MLCTVHRSCTSNQIETDNNLLEKQWTLRTKGSYSCHRCPEWRVNFRSVVSEQESERVTNHVTRKSSLQENDNNTGPPMVVETQHIFRRSLPPETVLSRSGGGADGDAPKFNEIVVVTTRRADEVHTDKYSTPRPYVPLNPPLAALDRPLFRDSASTSRRQIPEDDDELKLLKNRVERYRQDLVSEDLLTSPSYKYTSVSKEEPATSPSAYPTSAYSLTRPRFYSSSYDDTGISYGISPAVTLPKSTYRNPYCHCHPPTSTGSSIVSPAKSFTSLNMRYSTPKPVASSTWAYCPAVRRTVPHHLHGHPHCYSTDNTESLGFSRRSSSEQRRPLPSYKYLEEAGHSLDKLRTDLRSTANKFSKHRQMIDRYLNVDPRQRLENVEPAVIKKYDEVAERIPELLILNYGLNRRPLDVSTLWSTSIEAPGARHSRAAAPSFRYRNGAPFEIRGRIRSVVSKVRTAHSVPRF